MRLGGDVTRLQHTRAVDPVENAADRSRRNPVETRIHGGQRRLEIGGFFNVVETNHLHLVGNGNAVRSQSEQRSQRKLVIECHNPVERNSGIDELLRNASAGADRPILARVHHQSRIEFDTSRGACFEHAAESQLRVAFNGVSYGINVFRFGSRAHHRESSCSMIEQVFGGKAGFLNIVGGNVVGFAVCGTRAHAYERIVHVQVRRFKVFDFGDRQDHAVRDGGVEVAQE